MSPIDHADRADDERRHALRRAGGIAHARAGAGGLGAARSRQPPPVAVVAAAGEADGQLLQLAVEVRALQPRPLRHAAHVALLASQQLLEVDPLECLARLAQGQLEEARRDLRGHRLIRRGGLAQEPLHVLGR